MNSYVEKLKKDLSYKESFDVTFREIRTKYHHYTIIFLNFFIEAVLTGKEITKNYFFL